jgi:hypothetical protein
LAASADPAPWIPTGPIQQVSYRHAYVVESSRTHLARTLILTVGAALALAIVGWRVFLVTTGGPSVPAAGAVAATTSGPNAEPARIVSKLTKIALRSSDFRPGNTISLTPDGDQVAGQVTLDNCGFDFTTEAHRVARRQYLLANSAGQNVGLSNELVAYDSPHQAALALRQWYKAAAHCPSHAVRSAVVGVPSLKVRVSQDVRHRTGLPNKLNVITAEKARTTDAAGLDGQHTLFNISILQVRGRILDAVYVTEARQLTHDEVAIALHMADVTGRRLRQHG